MTQLFFIYITLQCKNILYLSNICSYDVQFMNIGPLYTSQRSLNLKYRKKNNLVFIVRTRIFYQFDKIHELQLPNCIMDFTQNLFVIY